MSSERGLSDDDDDDDNEPPPELTAHARDVEPESTRLMSARRWGRIRLPGAEGERLSGMSVLELARRRGMGARERALWRWVNVVDLDAFLREVYDYYTGKGIYAIALSKLLDLLYVASLSRLVCGLLTRVDAGHLAGSSSFRRSCLAASTTASCGTHTRSTRS